MHEAAEQVVALGSAAARADLAAVAPVYLGSDAFEPLVTDQRLVTHVGFDPLVGLAADQRAFALLDGAKVETVPVEPARVDVVAQDAHDRRPGPLPAMLRLLSTCWGGWGPPGRLRWLTISL